MTGAMAESLLHPDEAEVEELGVLRDRIDEIYHCEGKALLIGPNVKEEPIELPASAFDALRLVVESMARGNTIVLMPHGKELTTQEAADMLHVSRPYLTKLCDDGVIPFHRVGTHRRICIEDVLEYRDKRSAERREYLKELTQASEELEGGYR